MIALAVLCGLAVAAPAPAADEVNPGLRAVVAASTDIVVVEVLETTPRQAIEGARDTAKFKVVHSIKGVMAVWRTGRRAIITCST